MKSKVMLLVVGLLLVLFSHSFAQVPQMINYQGKITTSAGLLTDTLITMTFNIYADSQGLTFPLWGEVQDSVKLEKGVFSVLLGVKNPIPASVFDGSVRYLEVIVGSDLGMRPLKPIVSVAYAYHSGDWTIAGDNIYRLNGNVGIGTTSPDDQLEITGTLRLPATTSTAGMIKVEGDRFIHSYGEGNTFIGKNAGNLTMTGDRNSANGMWALYSNTTGNTNTANGYYALYSNTTGWGNTADGIYALTSNTTGWYNTANGRSALYYNTTGNENTANGQAALYLNRTGCCNTADGFFALYHDTGSYNTADGYYALYSNTTGNYNTALGYYADVSSGNLTNATAIGSGAIVNASNKVRIGNSSVTVIEGQVDWSFPSDARLKTNVQESPLGLDFVLKLKPITYNSLAQGQEGITYTGLIAQDVEKVLDELAIEFSGLVKPANKDDSYSLRYATFVMPLIKALQEQQEQIKALQQRIEELEKR